MLVVTRTDHPAVTKCESKGENRDWISRQTQAGIGHSAPDM